MCFNAGFVSVYGNANASADGDRSGVLEGSGHQCASRNVGQPVLQMGREDHRVAVSYLHDFIVPGKRRWKLEGGSGPRLQNGFMPLEASSEALSDLGCLRKVGAHGHSIAEGPQLVNDGGSDVMPKPTGVTLGSSAQKQTGRSGTGGLIGSHKATAGASREERLDV